jgi:hypothetical protein
MDRLDLLYFDAGGGHRAAANALRQVIEDRGLPFEIRLVNLQEVLDSLDIFRKLTGLRLQDVYNLLLKKGWTLGSAQLTAGMHLVIRLFHRQQVRTLEAFWRQSRPDMVVSLVPNFNRALAQSLRSALPGIPLVTILTDIADYPPHFWLDPEPQDIICGSEKAVQQALAMGHAPARVHRVSGMILNPGFYQVAPLSHEERAAARVALGLDAALPTGLVLFGGQGARVIETIVRQLPDRQLIVICGHNQSLHAAISQIPRKAPIYIEGFTTDIPRYMQLSDYMLGKPGPGSLSEAVAMHLPVIVESNAWTLPQERYNPLWVEEHGIGLVLPNFRQIASAVNVLLEASAYPRYRAATERIANNAVFEIPVLLRQILEQSRGGH